MRVFWFFKTGGAFARLWLMPMLWPVGVLLLLPVPRGPFAEVASAPRRSVTIPATLDRTEGAVAVLYWGEAASDKVEIPVKYLPRDCPEGASLRVTISVDEAATRRLQKRIRALQRQLSQ